MATPDPETPQTTAARRRGPSSGAAGGRGGRHEGEPSVQHLAAGGAQGTDTSTSNTNTTGQSTLAAGTSSTSTPTATKKIAARLSRSGTLTNNGSKDAKDGKGGASRSTSSSAVQSSRAIDPLSQHIYMRRNSVTDSSHPTPKVRSSSAQPTSPHGSDAVSPSSPKRASSELSNRGTPAAATAAGDSGIGDDTPTGTPTSAIPQSGGTIPKDAKSKRSSFLTRLSSGMRVSSGTMGGVGKDFKKPEDDTLSELSTGSANAQSQRFVRGDAAVPRGSFTIGSPPTSVYSARGGGGGAGIMSESATSSPTPGGFSYIPRHKEPPRYVKVKAKDKKVREFSRVFLAQELVGTVPNPPRPDVDAGETKGGDGEPLEARPTVERTASTTSAAVGTTSSRRGPRTGGAIWAMEFSTDGRYLAAAGKDAVVRVWSVISTREEREEETLSRFGQSQTSGHEDDVADDGAAGVQGDRLRAPVFLEKPTREFVGHTGEVLDLSWSKNNFLLSSSMDKTVRLWHISRKECLCTFKHKDFVTSIAFHPRDDRFFLAGSLDSALRLWSIPDKTVAYGTQLPDMVTAVGFSPDGKTAIAGVLSGLCLFFETEGLKFTSQIHVRSSRGRNAKGSKITGIRTMTLPPPMPNLMYFDGGSGSGPGSVVGGAASVASAGDGTGSSQANSRRRDVDATGAEVKVLVSSNDSRIRVYNLRDKALDVKLKGHENQCSQIRASFSDDGRYVICGSEDRKCYVWSLSNSAIPAPAPSSGSGSGPNAGRSILHPWPAQANVAIPTAADMTASAGKDKATRPLEYFDAHTDMVTATCIAPTRTRQLLGASGDPIYDLCNPPAVTLLSRAEESHASATASEADLDAYGATGPRHSATSLNTNGTKAPPGHGEDASGGVQPQYVSPAYAARSTHYDGLIIVTASRQGLIRVFRQDCAYAKRRASNETFSAAAVAEQHHSGQSKRRSVDNFRSSTGTMMAGRSASILTRSSAGGGGGGGGGRHSRSGSLGAQTPASVSAATFQPQTGTPSAASTAAGDHGILSWRQNIEQGTSPAGQGRQGSGGGTLTRSERSVSPSKLGRGAPSTNVPTLASEARRAPYTAMPSSPTAGTHGTGTPPPVIGGSRRPPPLAAARSGEQGEAQGQLSVQPLTPSTSVRSETTTAADSDVALTGGDDHNGAQAPDHMIPRGSSDAVDKPEDEDDAVGASFSFWNIARWRGIAGLSGGQRPSVQPSTSPPLSSKEAGGDNGDVAAVGPAAAPASGTGISRRRSLNVVGALAGSGVGSIISGLGSTLMGGGGSSVADADKDSKEKDKTAATPAATASLRGRSFSSARSGAAGRQPAPEPIAEVPAPRTSPGVTDNTSSSAAAGAPSRYSTAPSTDEDRTRQPSVMSRLTSEITSTDDEEDRYNNHPDEEEEEEEEEEEDMRCPRCGGREFKARRVLAGAQRGVPKLVCGRCGRVASDEATGDVVITGPRLTVGSGGGRRPEKGS